MAEVILDGGDHKVLHVQALDVLGGGDMGDGRIAVAAVEGEGDLNLSLLSQLISKPSRAPSDVRAFDRDAAIVETDPPASPLLMRLALGHERQSSRALR